MTAEITYVISDEIYIIQGCTLDPAILNFKYGKGHISALASVISEYGNVEEIICDNGKQFMTQA